MNILLVVNNAYDQEIRYLYFEDISDETHEVIKSNNSIYLGQYHENENTLLLEEILQNKKEQYKEVKIPIGGLFIDIIYEYGYC